MTGVLRPPARALAALARALAALALVLGLAGCSSAPAVPGNSSDADQVRDRYAEYWRVVRDVSASSSADLSELSTVARGTQLRTYMASQEKSRAQGLVSDGPVVSNIRDVTVDGDRAYVIDDLDISQWLLRYESTGEVVEYQNRNPACARYQFTLARDEGQWYVTQADQVGSCGEH